MRPERATWEVARVLKPGGVFVMTTNNASELPLWSPLTHLFVWLEKALGAYHPSLISRRPWVWPHKMDRSILPADAPDVWLPHTHHIYGETRAMFAAAGLDAFEFSTFEFPPPQAKLVGVARRARGPRSTRRRCRRSGVHAASAGESARLPHVRAGPQDPSAGGPDAAAGRMARSVLRGRRRSTRDGRHALSWADRLKREVVQRHGRLRPVLPRGYHAYRGEGGWTYLDVRESPMMLARAAASLRTGQGARLARRAAAWHDFRRRRRQQRRLLVDRGTGDG